MKKVYIPIGLSVSSIVVALMITTGFLLAPASPIPPSKQIKSSQHIVLQGKDFRAVKFDGGHYAGDTAVISGLMDGEGILEAKTRFDASHFPLVKIDINGFHSGVKVVLFWSSSENSQNPNFEELDLYQQGGNWTAVNGNSNWSGPVDNIAIGVFGDLRDQPLSVSTLEFWPDNAFRRAVMTVGGWLHFKVWTQASINQLTLGSQKVQSPTLFLGSSWLLSIVIFWFASALGQRSDFGQVTAHAAISFLTLWLTLDILWQRQLFLQLGESRVLFSGKTMHDKKLSDIDGASYDELAAIRNLLPAPGPRIWILTAERDSFLAYRTKFHLTPHQTYYYHDAGFMHYLMTRFGAAEAGDYLLSIDSVSRLEVDSINSAVKLYDFCWEGDSLYRGENFNLIRLDSPAVKCKT